MTIHLHEEIPQYCGTSEFVDGRDRRSMTIHLHEEIPQHCGTSEFVHRRDEVEKDALSEDIPQHCGTLQHRFELLNRMQLEKQTEYQQKNPNR
jgi:hypothetical protein